MAADTIKWLSRAKNITAELKQIEEQINRAREEATKITPHIKDVNVQTSSSNSTERKLIAIVEYIEILDNKQAELYAVKTEIEIAIERVDDDKLRELLRERYINGKSWESVAESINKSEYWTRTALHDKAIHAIEKSRGC